MVRDKKVITISALLWFVSLNASINAAEFEPFKKDNETYLFDAGVSDCRNIVNYTASWIKNGNLRPRVTVEERNHEKWLSISYDGDRGGAVSRIDVAPDKLKTMPAPGKEFRGVAVSIDYDGEDYEPLKTRVEFTDNSFVCHDIPLRKGVREYPIEDGYRRSNSPPNWEKIRYLLFRSNTHKLKFSLRKITMREKEATPKSVPLKIDTTKRFLEVLPSKKTLTLNDDLDSGYLAGAGVVDRFYALKTGNATPEKDSPLKLRIAYDDTSLRIETAAEFPEEPLANALKHDDQVYQDEAIEYFFSPWNDNEKKIQLVMNWKGVVFDYLRDYDKTAAEIISDTRWDLSFQKRISYAKGVWTTQLLAPLKELKINLSAARLVGFQLAQNYKAGRRAGEKYRSLAFSPTDRFPNPLNFGALVFNREAFGRGKAEIAEVRREAAPSDIEAAFKTTVILDDFAPGTYRVEKILAPPQGDALKQTENVVIEKANARREFMIGPAKNRNGVYSVYLLFHDARDNILATGLNFDNATPLKERFGETLFCPTPKRALWGKDVFLAGKARRLRVSRSASGKTQNTAALFLEKLRGFTMSDYALIKSETAETPEISLEVTREGIFAGDKVKIPCEGYCLNVNATGVTISGADEAGLYYGCVTFCQLLKAPMKITREAPVPSVQIFDWPDISNRLVAIHHTCQFRDKAFLEDPEIENLMDWIDRFVAENKYNRLLLDVSGLLKFERQPEFRGKERVFSLNDLKRLAEFCRARFVEPIPAFEVGGHADWWLLGHHPEFREKGFLVQADCEHPDHNKVVFNCFQDVIDAMGPRLFFVKSDEWWSKIEPKNAPSALATSGKPRSRAFLDCLLAFHDWLKQRNVRMMIYEDMLNPVHNGKRYDIYKVIDNLPKDIIINCWGVTPELTAAYFVEKGFEVWGNPTAYWTYAKDISRRVKGMGFTTYNLGTDWSPFRKVMTFSIFYIFRGADNAWNLHDDPRADIMDEAASGKLTALREMYAVRPNPFATPEVTAIDLEGQLNASFAKEILPSRTDALPSGTTRTGNIETRFASDKDKNCVVLDKNNPLSATIDKTCSSLIFLHTADIDAETQKNWKGHWRKWPYGYLSGAYRVYYANGATREIPLRLFWNVGLMNSHPLYRSANDTRYILSLADREGNYKSLYQFEWVNPFPRETIKRLTYVNDKPNDFNFKILLFAISARGVKEHDNQHNADKE